MEQYSLRRMRFYCKLKKRRLQNCTPSVRQYDILSNRWGDFNAKGSAEQNPCSGRAEIAGAVVPSRFMRKFVCRLRLSEVSRQ